jgi:chromosome segregation ATPase
MLIASCCDRARVWAVGGTAAGGRGAAASARRRSGQVPDEDRASPPLTSSLTSTAAPDHCLDRERTHLDGVVQTTEAALADAAAEQHKVHAELDDRRSRHAVHVQRLTRTVASMDEELDGERRKHEGAQAEVDAMQDRIDTLVQQNGASAGLDRR